MRVRRLGFVRVRDEERGATLAIVAISLICLLGMLVLTFDLGRGVALKRNMVNGADAAALAAARECGLAHGDVAAKQAAADLVADNNGAATVIGFRIDPSPAQCIGAPNPNPDGKIFVTVTTSVPQQYFFAPIFGINNGTVVATATAEVTSGSTNPAPIKIDQLKVDQCEEGVPDPVTGRIDCYFLFDKGSRPLESDWGWLNLPEGWPNQKLGDLNPMKCSSQAGGSKDLSDYIGGMGGMGDPGDVTPLPGLWDPRWPNTGTPPPPPYDQPPTYVCGATGLKESSVEAIQKWVDDLDPNMDPLVDFPVVAGELKYTPGVAYPVVNLQGFHVKEAQKGKKFAKEHCGYTGNSDRVFCIHLQTTGLDDSTSGGRPIVRLVD